VFWGCFGGLGRGLDGVLLDLDWELDFFVVQLPEPAEVGVRFCKPD
jgi:hypothetical protein